MPLNIILTPKKLFLLDGIGAAMTAILLYAVLPSFKEYIGMPQAVLNLLSLIACIYAFYSLTCYFIAGSNWRFLLKIIAIANLFYCSLTATLVVTHYAQLTGFGILYFVVEIIIISSLAAIEWKVTT